ncbi:uncharacterized protein [Macrobrachium rosenbergii]|uniref:uncharacterized protein n=1 Tax=Macrobrachium rosenbergii TaxID=79674 RepID=UPI0034D4A05E
MEEDNTHPTLWAVVKVLAEHNQMNDNNSKGKKQLISVTLNPHWTARDVQVALLKALGLGPTVSASAHNIVKVRDAHGALLPLTPTALHSSPVQPLVVEICGTHQHVAVEDSRVEALPPTFRTAVEAIIKRFEERLSAVETGLDGLQGRRQILVEKELHRIQETLNFMTRRLDLTRAPTWVTGQT